MKKYTCLLAILWMVFFVAPVFAQGINGSRIYSSTVPPSALATGATPSSNQIPYWINSTTFGWENPPSGSGTVTSVAVTQPSSTFSSTGSPITSSGTIAFSFVNQSANTFFRGPTSGSAAVPTWGSLVAADIPSLSTSILTSGTLGVGRGGTGQSAYTDGELLIGDGSTGGLDLATLTAGSNVTITNGHGTITIAASGGGGGVSSVGLTDSSGLFNVSGSPVTGSGSITLSYANMSANRFLAGPTSGSATTPSFRAIVPGDLWYPTLTYGGIVKASAGMTNEWMYGIDTSGNPLLSQPGFSNLSGTASASQCPAFGAAGSGHAAGILPDPGSTSHSGGPYYMGDDGNYHQIIAGSNITLSWASSGAGGLTIASSGGGGGTYTATAPITLTGSAFGISAATTSAYGSAQLESSSSDTTSTDVVTANDTRLLTADGSTITNSGGTISVPTATTSVKGISKPDGSTITISSGTESVPTATTSTNGLSNYPSSGGLTVSSGAVSEAQPITAIGSGLSLNAGTLAMVGATADVATCVATANLSNSGYTASSAVSFVSGITGSTAGTSATPSFTTTVANEMVVASIASTTASGFSTTITGYTATTIYSGAGISIFYYIVPTAGTYSTTVGASSGSGFNYTINGFSGQASSSITNVGTLVGPTTSTSASASVTPTTGGSMVVLEALNTSAHLSTAGTGYTIASSNSTFQNEYSNSMLTGSQSPTMTVGTSSAWYAIAFAIAPTPATTVDGVSINASGITILETDQTTATQDGPWVTGSSSSAFTRPSWWSTGSTQTAGTTFNVLSGTTYGPSIWMLTAPTSDTVDTSSPTIGHCH